MRFLKQLTLHGYKTFASRTDFVFDAGITAVVGPNGSGKSNIADALRWVLGEQSFSALRSKRTEDMIFSGSEQRARMGMAQVTLMLDNGTGWLPIEFSEVEISRRAFRSGENEYYLNGNRVRLRDIAELLGSSGLGQRTYSVIGQGLVDQALSQRPEERRRLFEEAAGITVHQSKRESACQRLAETAANLTRARDIISELTPRLRYLKGQARRAQEYQQLRADLDAHLQVWYSYRWHQDLLAVSAAKDRALELARSSDDADAELNAMLASMAERRAERAGLREQLSEWHRLSSEQHRQAEVVQRDLAVRNEQLRLWREQQAELERELAYLRVSCEDSALRLESAQAELAAAQADHDAAAGRATASQAELESSEAARRAQAAALTQAQETALGLRAQLAESQSRLAQFSERRSELARSQGEHAEAVAGAARQVAELEAREEQQTQAAAELAARVAEVERERQAQNAALTAAQEAERRALEVLSAAQRGLQRLQDQRDMLMRLREEGAGLAAGPRAVLSAAGKQLQGILGALGDLVEAPTELERAIEAALGSRVQDIVVRTWQDAEASVGYLRDNRAGRATFLPLDTLRPGRAVEAPRGAGVVGLASELVRFDAAIRPAIELALNHTVVVQDLPTARRLLRQVSGATLVTLDGELVRPSGSVTGGSEARTRDSGLLSRARTLREMPAQVDEAATAASTCEARVEQTRQAQASARTRLDALRNRRQELAAAEADQAAERSRVQLTLERGRQTLAWHEERGQAVARELVNLDARELEANARIAELAGKLAAQEEVVREARRALAALATDDLLADLARLRAEAAVSAGRLESYRQRAAELAASQRQREIEISTKESRVAALLAQQQAAAEAVDAQAGSAEGLAAHIAELDRQIVPAEKRLAELEVEQRQSEAVEHDLREALRTAQVRQRQADLAYQRAQDELVHLRGEIEKELGLVALTQAVEEDAGSRHGESEGLDSQPPLPLDGMVTRLPVVAQLPEDLDAGVRNLRAQLARLGPVNLDALAEYNEVEARFNFLTTQAADLEQAMATLQEVITELDRLMQREFISTFKAVAARFKSEFVNLFGGGSAKLVLMDPENPQSSGIEIVARPPGKREQGLALLSGGERALTAAALIFSILKTRPTPFCVLDEVDAALDEANVGRFRDSLKALSTHTQFILITHNRGTIEVADTIYGVSMGADNTSQTISLKLDGRELVHAESVEPE